MMYESVCRQCKFCISEEIVGKGAGGQPGLYELECEEGSANFQTQEGCWRYETAEDGEES